MWKVAMALLILSLSIFFGACSTNVQQTQGESKANTTMVNTSNTNQKVNTVVEPSSSKEENQNAQWNTKDIRTETNGNISVAVDFLRSVSPGQLKEQTEAVASNKSPWEYLGKPAKITGMIMDYGEEDDIIVDSEVTDYQIDYLTVENADNPDAVSIGDTVTVYGYVAGLMDFKNKLGSKSTRLVVVGKAVEKNSGATKGNQSPNPSTSTTPQDKPLQKFIDYLKTHNPEKDAFQTVKQTPIRITFSDPSTVKLIKDISYHNGLLFVYKLPRKLNEYNQMSASTEMVYLYELSSQILSKYWAFRKEYPDNGGAGLNIEFVEVLLDNGQDKMGYSVSTAVDNGSGSVILNGTPIYTVFFEDTGEGATPTPILNGQSVSLFANFLIGKALVDVT
ncbi:MAG: hypothetical protein ACYCX4_14465 [Bacillota bacterium]